MLLEIHFKSHLHVVVVVVFVDDDDDDNDDDNDDDDDDVREVFLCRLVFYMYKGYLEDVRILETRMFGLGGLKWYAVYFSCPSELFCFS